MTHVCIKCDMCDHMSRYVRYAVGIVGDRYHMMGSNYNLCPGHFKTLPEEQTTQYELISAGLVQRVQDSSRTAVNLPSGGKWEKELAELANMGFGATSEESNAIRELRRSHEASVESMRSEGRAVLCEVERARQEYVAEVAQLNAYHKEATLAHALELENVVKRHAAEIANLRRELGGMHVEVGKVSRKHEVQLEALRRNEELRIGMQKYDSGSHTDVQATVMRQVMSLLRPV